MVQRLFRLAFWAALLVCFAMAIWPKPIDLGVPSDKFQHISAFVVLTILFLLAYEKAKPLAVFVFLAAFGGLIEIVQGFSFIGRDRDLLDWIVDMVAILAVMLIAVTVRGLRKDASAGV